MKKWKRRVIKVGRSKGFLDTKLGLLNRRPDSDRHIDKFSQKSFNPWGCYLAKSEDQRIFLKHIDDKTCCMNQGFMITNVYEL